MMMIMMCLCTYVQMLACIYLYVGKGEDKEIEWLKKRDKNFPLCSGNSFRHFDFSFSPRDILIKYLLRTGIKAPDSLSKLSLVEEIAGNYVVEALIKVGFASQGTK